MRSTNSGLGRVHEVRECYSAKLICVLIINYYLGSEISYHLGGRISILDSASRKFSRILALRRHKFLKSLHATNFTSPVL
jgi:hypothetical protein